MWSKSKQLPVPDTHYNTKTMYKEILRSIDNIQVWPVISFAIFFLFFLILLGWAFTVDKVFIRQMSEMPLEDGTNSVKNQNPSRL